MTDTQNKEMIRINLVKILKELLNDEGTVDISMVKNYTDTYDNLVNELRDNETLRGLMSQAMVPRLIRRMEKISDKDRENMTAATLSGLLVKEHEEDINEDYPYSKTRIIETLVGFQGDDEPDLNNILSDPLLVTAVVIANKMVEKDLSNADWIKVFSKAVNQIQDAIIRQIIAAKVQVVPLVGDLTFPDKTKAGELTQNVKNKRAFGLGENPNPEMAAMLNPALGMTDAQQEGYYKELLMLSELISPKDKTSTQNLENAFKYAGFKVGEVESTEPKQGSGDGDDELSGDDQIIDEVGEVDEVDTDVSQELKITKEQWEQAQKEIKDAAERIEKLEFDLNAEETREEEAQTKVLTLNKRVLQLETEATQSKKTVEDLNKQVVHLQNTVKTREETIEKLEERLRLLPETDEEEEEEEDDEEEKTPKDYKGLATAFLIQYLGVPDNIVKLTKDWIEFYADNSTDPIFTNYISVLKGDDDDDDDDDDEPTLEEVLHAGLSSLIVTHEKIGVMRPPSYNEVAEVTLDHNKILELWEAAIGIDDKPKKGDLVIQKAALGPKGKEMAKNIKALLSAKIESSLPKQQPRLTQQINTSTERRRSRQKRNSRKDERVLIW